jgi:hypothetical protein
MRLPTPRQIRIALLCAIAGAALLLADVSPAVALSVVPLLGHIAAVTPGPARAKSSSSACASCAPQRPAGGAARMRPADYLRPPWPHGSVRLAMRPPSVATACA